MAVGNKRLRFFLVCVIIINCAVLLLLQLSCYLPGNAYIENNATDSVVFLPSPAPIIQPLTEVTSGVLSRGVRSHHDKLDDLMLTFRKFASGNFSLKISALKAPRLDRLWNVWNMSYPIDRPDICQDDENNVSTVVVVMSSPGNFLARNGIRSTWGGNLTNNIQTRVIYFVGMSNDPVIEQGLLNESAITGDIVQASFVESYKNLTIKSVLLLRWVSTRCPKSSFVLKVDDDVFIHPTNLQKFVDKQKLSRLKIFGHAAHQWHPVRANSSHYYVQEDHWTSSIYPDFVTGPAYLLTMDAVPRLLKQVSKVPFFFLEDVYVTGILAQKASIPRVNSPKFRNIYIPVNPCVYHTAISIHRLDPTTMLTAWSILHKNTDTDSKECWSTKCSWMILGMCMATEKTPVSFIKRSNYTTVKSTKSVFI